MILLSLEILLFRNIGLNLQFIHALSAHTTSIITFLSEKYNPSI